MTSTVTAARPGSSAAARCFVAGASHVVMISHASASSVRPPAFQPPRTATAAEYRRERRSPVATPTTTAIAVLGTARRGAIRAMRRTRAGAAGRRDRPERRGIRGIPPRSALRFPGDGSRARYHPGAGATARHPHVEPLTRSVRRAPPALSVPVDRLPGIREGAFDRPPQGPRRDRGAGCADRRARAAVAAGTALAGGRGG